MSKSRKYTNKITALENELTTVRHELSLLQSSRSHRIAKFSKQLIKSSPKELGRTLREAPNLLKRHHIPAPENKTDGKVDLFSPLTNSLPLLEYPNINVATVCSPSSLIELALLQTSNTTPLNSTHALELMQYSALQIVAVETSAYDKERDYSRIEESIESGARLILFKNKDSIIPEELEAIPHTFVTLGISPKEDIGPFSDIYSITQRTVPRKIPAEKSNLRFIRSIDDIDKAAHDKLSVITKGLIDNIDDHTDACRLLDKIASYCPVIIEGRVPIWLPSNLRSFTSDEELAVVCKELSKPYSAERYAINCGRQSIVEFNSLGQISKLYKKLGIIYSLPDNPKVSVILSTRRPQFLSQALEQLEKQTLRPHEVIIMLHGIENSEHELCIQQISKSPLNVSYEFVGKDTLFGDVLNLAVDKASGDFATKIDDDDYYMPNHLLDLYAAHLSSRADFVGKWNNWVYISNEDMTVSWTPESAHMYVRHIPGGTVFGKTAIFREMRFGKVKRAIDSELYRRAIRRGAVLYSTHRYNYIRVRHDDHTYTASDADFKSRADGNTIKGLPLSELSA